MIYNYAINAPEHRNDFRSAMLSHMFDYKDISPQDEDKTFAGFTKSAMSMIDQLDAGL